MAATVLTVLKIIGIVLLIILGVLFLLIVAVLFVPVRYEIEGIKDTDKDILRFKVRAHWFLYILYARASYEMEDKSSSENPSEESSGGASKKGVSAKGAGGGHLEGGFNYIARLFGFPIKRRGGASEAKEERKKKKKKLRKKAGETDQRDKEEKKDKEDPKVVIKEEKDDKGGSENKGSEENVKYEDIEYKIETYEDVIEEAVEEDKAYSEEKAAEVDEVEEPENAETAEGTDPAVTAEKQDAGEAGKADTGETEKAGTDEFENVGTGEGKEKAEKESENENKNVADDDDEEEERKSFFGKIKEYLQKVCDLLRNLKEKLASAARQIKHLKDEVCFHYDFLTDEKNQEQFENLFKELGRVLRHMKPKKFNARLLIGMEDPADTGTALAILSMIYPLFNGKFEVTPCFDRSIIDFRLLARGRAMVAVLLYAGYKVYFHKGFRKMLRKYKNRKRSR